MGQNFDQKNTLLFPDGERVPFNTFTDVTSIGYIRDHLPKFEKLLGLPETLTNKYVLDKFIGGLEEEMMVEVVVSNPNTFKEGASWIS